MTSAPADLFEPKQRFVGMRNNGERVNDERVTEWFDEKSVPKLASQPIFDAGNPFRWLIDQAVPLPKTQEAFIEFQTGDCLPGRIVDYVPAQPNSFEASGELLVVEPLVSIDVPGQPVTPYLRIELRWLRRVVFQKRSTNPQRYQPGTVFLHDGSQKKFKGVRWSPAVLAILTDDGIESLLFSQVAELHMPTANSWDVYFEQLASLTPNLDSRLMQIESSEGLILTASTERYRPQSSGDRNKSENWYPQFQPAWSLDPITVPFKQIRAWRFFSPFEPPMTIFEPEVSRDSPVFSGGWNWQRNQSVQRSTLRHAEQLFGWGFGVHAPTVLSFEIHPVVTGARSRSGLDSVVEKGGCTETLVALSTNEASPIHKSGHLIGSARTIDTNWLNVAAAPTQNVDLRFKADPVIASRPKGADPFDIRDCVDWLEPQWRLDPAKTKAEVQSRLSDSLVPLRGWSISPKLLPGELTDDEEKSAKPGIDVVGFRDDVIPTAPRYRLVFKPRDQFAVASRDFRIGKNDQWLAVCVSRTGKETTPTLAQVRVDGKALIQQLIPERTSRLDPDPILVPVSQVAGKKIRVEVVLVAQGDKSYVDWRGVRTVEHRPGLAKLFDEEDSFLKQLHEGEAEAGLSTTETQSGKSSLKISGGELANANIDGWGFPIREFPHLGEYRYFMFSWKKDGGDGIGLRVGHDGMLGIPEVEEGRQKKPRVFRPAVVQAAAMRNRERRVRNPRTPPRTDDRGARFGYQYDAGKREVEEPVMRLDRLSPEKWTTPRRDIFAEFGAFSLTGMSFICPDGKAAYFDGIYLARTQDDFNFVPEFIGGTLEAPPGEDANIAAAARRPENSGNLLARVAPQFTLDKIGEPVRQLKEFAGRKDIIQTMPPAQGAPCVLRAPVSVRAGKKTVLVAEVNRHEQGDWQLIVKVGSEQLHASMVNADSTKDDWAKVEVDLSKFTGKNIVVEVHNHPNDWNYEYAYWSRLEIVQR